MYGRERYDVRRGDDGSAKLYPPEDAPPDVPTLWLQNNIGQTGAESFVVLADPEGNEFCVLKREPR